MGPDDVSKHRIGFLSAVAILVAGLFFARVAPEKRRAANVQAQSNGGDTRLDEGGTPRRTMRALVPEVLRLRALASAPLHRAAPTFDATSVITLDEMHPGIGEDLDVDVDAAYALHREMRRCRAEMPPDLPRIRFSAVTKYERIGPLHHLAEIQVTSDSHEFGNCVRDAYYRIAPEIGAPAFVSSTMYLREAGGYPAENFTDISQLRRKLDNYRTEFAESDDDYQRVLIMEGIEYLECLERRGLDQRRACAWE